MHSVAERQLDRVKLLLVDRSPADAAMLATGLERAAAGLDVTAVSGGRRAADLLRMHAFEVVLLDLASLREIADEPRNAVSRLIRLAGGALAIALSSDLSISAAVEVMRSGAHDCIHRGIAAEALTRHIAGLARRHGKSRILNLLGISSGTEVPDAGTIASRAPARSPAVLPMWKQEQRIIEDAIANFAGNIALAAAALELSPSTIYRKRQAWAEIGGKQAPG